jgi:hypothetical protein
MVWKAAGEAIGAVAHGSPHVDFNEKSVRPGRNCRPDTALPGPPSNGTARSTITGRWLFFEWHGADIQVLRVSVSNVRIRRSHNITFRCPAIMAGGHEKFFYRRAKTAFKNYGLVDIADLVEPEIRHVAGPIWMSAYLQTAPHL